MRTCKVSHIEWLEYINLRLTCLKLVIYEIEVAICDTCEKFKCQKKFIKTLQL